MGALYLQKNNNQGNNNINNNDTIKKFKSFSKFFSIKSIIKIIMDKNAHIIIVKTLFSYKHNVFFAETKMTGAIQEHLVNENMCRRKGLTQVSGIKLVATMNRN